MKLTIQEICEAVQGQILPSQNALNEIECITTDSRQTMKNGLFIPLKGERFDGHEFIASVYEKGAIATLTMTSDIVDSRLVTIEVKDTQKALLDLAKYYRQKFLIPVIGITGSVGKTSTKEMIAAVLSGKWQVHKTLGNFNNEIGLPLTLFQLNEGHDAAVIEMGMNHFGEIHRLACTAKPDAAVITNIGTAHIENLGSREGILKAKLEILDGLNPKGLLVVNGDNDLLGHLSSLNINKLTYGLSDQNDYWAQNIRSEGRYTLADVTSPNETYDIRIEALGEHMVYNTLAAIAIAEYYGLTKKEIMNGLTSYKPTKKRMYISQLSSGLTIMDDTYNASLDSMKAALKVLKDYNVVGRKVAVLGDMLELGKFAPDLHEEVGCFAQSMSVDVLIGIGTLAKHIIKGYQNAGGKKAHYFTTKEAFLSEMDQLIRAEDCVLFKASKDMYFGTLVEEVKVK